MALPDSSCMHLDSGTGHCAVYAQRPLVCRIDDVFRQRVAGIVPSRVFYLLQARSCATLDARNGDLPRVVAEQLVDSEEVDTPGSHMAPREARVEAMLKLDPDEVHASMPHILGVARDLMLQRFEPADERSPMRTL